MNNETFGYNPRLTAVCQERLSMTFYVIGIVTIASILVVGLVGNSLVCISMVKCSFLRQSLSNFLVASLAVSDLMVCTCVLPFDIIYWTDFPRWTIGGYACNMWNALFYLMMTASVMNLLSISGDRFIAVVYPLRYPTWLTYRAIKILIGSVWVYSLGVGVMLFVLLIPPDGDHYSFDLGEYGGVKWYLNIVNVLIPFAIMVSLYIKIYVIARDHSRRMNSMQNKRQSGFNQTIADTLRRELRVAKALGVIVLCFLLCWLPYVIMNIITLKNTVIHNCSIELADTITCWFAYLNSAINPVLYAYTNRDYRRAFKSLLSFTMSRNERDTKSRSRTLSSVVSLQSLQRRCTQRNDNSFDTKL